MWLHNATPERPLALANGSANSMLFSLRVLQILLFVAALCKDLLSSQLRLLLFFVILPALFSAIIKRNGMCRFKGKEWEKKR